MNISFLVTTHNETDSLFKLLLTLNNFIKESSDKHNEVVILDDFSDNKDTIEVLNQFKELPNFSLHQHTLNKNYGEHKNYGSSKCNMPFIFQLDGDELPAPTLLYNINDIIDANPSVDLYTVPRINIVHGLTQEYVNMFKWRVTPIDNYPNVINWPDRQSRIYRKASSIKWDRRLHEHIVGANVTTNLPEQSDFALIHEKTIQRQLEQNLFYNNNFSLEDNVRMT